MVKQQSSRTRPTHAPEKAQQPRVTCKEESSGDCLAWCSYATPDREIMLRLTLSDYVRRFGPTPHPRGTVRAQVRFRFLWG